jgi:hypothetical protein
MANEVEIRVTAKDVDTEKTFTAVRAKAKRAGADAGDDFSGSFSGKLDLSEAVDKQADEVRKTAPKFSKAGEELGDETRKGFKKNTDQIPKDTQKVAARTQAQFEAMSFAAMFGGMPVAAAAATAATVGSLAGVSAGFIALEAVALHSDQEVSGAYEDLGTHVQESLTQLAQPMKGDLVEAAQKLGAEFDHLQPQISSAMLNSRRDVSILTDGVIDLANEAMPGLVLMTSKSESAFRGLASFMGSTGRGVTDFFVNVSQGSSSAERNLALLGGTVQRALGFFGSLLANISNNGTPALHQFDTGLSLVEQTLLTLTSNGSAAISMLGGFAGATNGALGILSSAASLLNLIPGQLTGFGGALLATSKIAGMFGIDIGKAFDGLGKKVNNAKGMGEKLKAGFTGLVSGAFSPVTVAAGAVAVGLELLGQRQQDAAADAAAHADRVRDLSNALLASGGAISANVRSLAQSQLAAMQFHDGTRNLIQDVDKLAGPSGINLLTDGYMGNSQALDQLKTKLQGVVDEHTHAASGVELLTTKFGDMRTMGGGVIGTMDDTGKSAQQLLDIINQEGGSFGEASKFAQDLSAAQNSAATSAGQLGYSQKLAQAASGELTSAFKTLASTESDVATKGTAMQTVLDTLTGRVPSHEEAIQSLNDTIRQLADEFGKNVDKTEGWGRALLNADGTVNTVTKNGSMLQDNLVTLQKGFTDAGASVDDLVKGGMSFADAQARVNGELSSARQRFIDMASSMGLTKQQAEELANKYGLIPAEVSTLVSQPGMSAAQQAAEILRGKVISIPNQWTTVTTALTQDAVTKLEQLGYKVQTLPNGTVVVTANTGPAAAAMQAFIHRYDGTSVTVNGVVQWTVHHDSYATGGLVGRASGGLVKRAGGGIVHAAGGMLFTGPGGMLSGPGTGTSDSIPAMVSNGEYVVNAQATRRNRGLLEAINRGATPGSGLAALGASTPRGGGSVATAPAPVVVSFDTTGAPPLVQSLVEMLQRYVRINGGNVQTVLGRGN